MNFCTAEIKSGKRCRGYKTKNSEYCNFHQPKTSEHFREENNIGFEKRDCGCILLFKHSNNSWDYFKMLKCTKHQLNDLQISPIYIG